MLYQNIHTGCLLCPDNIKKDDLVKVIEIGKQIGDNDSRRVKIFDIGGKTITVIHNKDLKAEDVRCLYGNISDPTNWKIL